MTTTAGAPASDRKAAITGAAAELFAAKGFAGAGIDEIGARAGVTGPAIYRHFRGKEALLRAVVMEAVTAFDVAERGASRIDQLAADAVAVAIDHPARLVTYLRERHRLEGDAKAELEETERRIFRIWRTAIGDLNPSLRTAEVAQRHSAVSTAMAGVASRAGSVPRPALDHLVASSMVAVLAKPPVPARSPRREQPTWSVPPTKREQILVAALRLFRERGYHGVSMDDIGEAVGITGPTIYFHYPSKRDVLADAHERASIRTWVTVQDAVRQASSASDALDRMALAQLTVAADHSHLIVVTSREVAGLDREDRDRFEHRAREIIDLWTAVVGELRPGLGAAELRTAVLGVFPLMNQTAYVLDQPADGVGLVRAWALGAPDA